MAIDLRKTQKELYNPPHGKVQIVTVPAMHFLAIDGAGDPNNSPAYDAAVSTLYTVAYGLKMARKKLGAADQMVPPLEGRWWVAAGGKFSFTERDDWRWTMMLRVPDDTTQEQYAAVIAAVAKKKQPANLGELRLEQFTEGLVGQTLHLGPYADEPPTIDLLHNGIIAAGYTLRDKHHEIYLSDPRRSAPEKMRTILRQPAQAGANPPTD